MNYNRSLHRAQLAGRRSKDTEIFALRPPPLALKHERRDR